MEHEMTTEHQENKRIIKSMCSKDKLRAYLQDCNFEHEHDKEILSMIYLQSKDFGYVADSIGLSYAQTLERHKRAAKKLADLIKTR